VQSPTDEGLEHPLLLHVVRAILLAAAVQVEFEKAKRLKPGYHISGSRVWSRDASKLWVNYGSTDFNFAQAPHLAVHADMRVLLLQLLRLDRGHGVALQVAFERQTLKPVFHLIGYRLWVCKAIGYGLWVNLIQRAEPHHGLDRGQARVLRERGGDGIQRISEGAHGILLHSGHLVRRLLHGDATRDLRRAAAVHDGVGAHEVARDTDGVVQRPLGLVDHHLVPAAHKHRHCRGVAEQVEI
jgi:hypothetical protein